MRDEIWVRCEHCGVPHRRGERVCPTTGKPIVERRISRRAPPLASDLPRFPAPPSSTGSGRLRKGSSRPPEASLVAIGDVLEGKYQVLRVVGSGAMGTVFECEHRLLRRRVAVKVLHAATASDPLLMRRFRHEARIAGALGHPNLCNVLDLGETPTGVPFLVMELLTGETLAERIEREQQLPFDVVCDVGVQMLAGLAAAHEADVVHRDLKPANVFLVNHSGWPNTVKIIDFGISKMLSSELTQLTRLGNVVGTPAYMAPEQSRGQLVDARADVYSAGVVLYECVTGRRPFEAPDLESLFGKIQAGLFPSIRLFRPDVPEPLDRLILRAMQRDPAKRYASALDMQRDLRAISVHVAARTADVPHIDLPPSSRDGDAVSIELDDRALRSDADDDDEPTEVRPPKPLV